MTNQDGWNSSYSLNPYLSKLTEGELNVRRDEIINACYFITADNKLSICNKDMIETFSHIVSEYKRRGIACCDGGISKYPRTPNIDSDWDKYNNKGYVFKYSKSKYLRKMYDCGALRITLSKCYKFFDIAAIQDDENNITTTHNNLSIRNLSSNSIYSPDFVKKTTTANDDFYMYCLSNVFDRRLFDDFDANACMVIRDKESFFDKVHNKLASQKAIKKVNDCDYFDGNVRYVDKYRCEYERKLFPQFDKDIKYSYQKENRIAWVCESGAPDVLELKIGCMHNYADYMEI
jgi:hypothetical protein